MSIFASRSLKAPYIDDSVLNPASFQLNDARRAAWAFAIGESRPSADPPPGRRLGRANLPDVDFSRAVPVPGKPSLLRRLAQWLAFARRPVEAQPDEWRVLRPLSARVEPVRHVNNVISINRAA
jgi:hypothetical protein